MRTLLKTLAVTSCCLSVLLGPVISLAEDFKPRTRVAVVDGLEEAITEKSFDTRLNAPERLQLPVLVYQLTPARLPSTPRPDHQILGRGLGGHELDDLGAVPCDLQSERSERVGQDVGRPLLEDPVSQHRTVDLGGHLSGQLLLTAGRGKDEGGLPGHSPRQGLIGRRIAGVQREHDVRRAFGLEG